MKKLFNFKTLMTIALVLITFFIALQGTVLAEVSIDSDGGSILTNIGDPVIRFISDIISTLMRVIPIIGVLMIAWYIVKMQSGDEQDQMRYKKAIFKVIACIIIAELAVVIVNLILNYFE